jgi:cell division protein FtsW
VIAGLRRRVGGIRAVRASNRYLDGPFASVQLIAASGSALLFLGLLMSASTSISASMHTTGSAIWTQLVRECGYLLASVPVFWLAMRMPPRVYRALAYPALLVGLGGLASVLVPGVGVTINSATRWVDLGPVTLQPSEFAKLAILLWGADLLARKEQLKTLVGARHVLIPLVPMFGVMAALVMAEPDLGTTLCFILILLGLLWMAGLPIRYFAVVIVAVGAMVTTLAITEPYRLLRLTTFLHPFADRRGAGYHTVEGLYAVSSGGIFGVGLGQGTSKWGWVPNANTDYVFAVVGEELGLLGCVVVLLLFGVFTVAALRIARRCSDTFVRLVASGAAVWIAGQALINIGYVTALLPVTGIPLPFISNGGTSLILTCGVLGMLVSFARHEPAAIAAARHAQSTATTARWVRFLRLGVPRPQSPGTARSTRRARPATVPTPPPPAPVRAARARSTRARADPARSTPVPTVRIGTGQLPDRSPATPARRQRVGAPGQPLGATGTDRSRGSR